MELLEWAFHQENWILDFESIQGNLSASDSERLLNYFLSLEELSSNGEQELLTNARLEMLAEEMVAGWERKFGLFLEEKHSDPCRESAARSAVSVMAGGFTVMGYTLAVTAPIAPATIVVGVAGTCTAACFTWLINVAKC